MTKSYYSQFMLGDSLRTQSGPVLITGITGFKGAWLSQLLTYLEIEHRKRLYHIPVKYLALYFEHPDPNQVMSLIQDALKIVK